MTILEVLIGKRINNKILDPALEVIKENYNDITKDNYELIIDNDGELMVKIPSLTKKDDYDYNKITEYEYQLILCMKISELYNGKHCEYIAKKFLEIYNDKLEMLYNDVISIEELKIKVKEAKNRIEYSTYISIGSIVLQGIILIIFNNISTVTKAIIALGTILLFVISIIQQFTKDKQIKAIINEYVNVLKTEWYKNQIVKQYMFFCNIMD